MTYNTTPIVNRPVRIQRKRTRGWRKPPNTIYVGRPSRFGNPMNRIAFWHSPEIRELYKAWYGKGEAAREIKQLLKGKNLMCWCPLDKPCHADILLEIANS